MGSPLISVLMPVYNTPEEYLRESIESILCQTFSDFELIILDDGSDYNIECICSTYNDNRIKFFKNDKNNGIAKSRNKLITLATADYIAFQDSDDVSMPKRLETEYEFLLAHEDISGVSSSFEIFPDKRIIHRNGEVKLLDFLSLCNFAQVSCMLRKAHFEVFSLLYDENYSTCEDYDLWSRSIQKLKLFNIPEVLLKYRYLDNSLSHNDYTKRAIFDKQIKQNLLNYLTSDNSLQNSIMKLIEGKSNVKYSLLELIFSVKNSIDKKYKIITIFGIHVKIKKRSKKENK